jgi:hypothetical protein
MAARIQPFDELLRDAVQNFEETFGRKPELAACAPGLFIFDFFTTNTGPLINDPIKSQISFLSPPLNNLSL